MRLERFQVLAALLIAFRDPRKPYFSNLLESGTRADGAETDGTGIGIMAIPARVDTRVAGII